MTPTVPPNPWWALVTAKSLPAKLREFPNVPDGTPRDVFNFLAHEADEGGIVKMTAEEIACGVSLAHEVPTFAVLIVLNRFADAGLISVMVDPTDARKAGKRQIVSLNRSRIESLRPIGEAEAPARKAPKPEPESLFGGAA